MASRQNITRGNEWHRYEKKRFTAAVLDDAGVPINLTGIALQWKLSRHHRSTTVSLTRTAAQFLAPEQGEVGIVLNVAVWEVSDTESGALPDGWYYHELWDRDNDALLVYGGALLQPGQAP